MAAPALRFLHASDLHLERPLGGLTEAPDTLRPALIDAPLLAAQRVFAVALEERVDFVLLSGDVCSPLAAGPRGLATLTESFEKLHEKKISIYWADGPAETDGEWPAAWQLPPNVHRFASNRWTSIEHERDGNIVARIFGTGFSQRGAVISGLAVENSDVPSIVVAYAEELPDTAAGRADYFGFGGLHSRQTVSGDHRLSHYPGTTQGRSPNETGPHGCTIVELDDARKMRTRFVPVDRVRWLAETVRVDAADAAALRAVLLEQLTSLAAANAGILCLVRWLVSGPPKLAQQISSATLGAELAEALRSQFAGGNSGVWTVGIEAAPVAPPADLYEQESLLGELLRSIRLYEEHPEQPLDLKALMGERYAAGTIGPAVALDDQDSRAETLSAAARLAVDLLTAPETRS